MNAFEQPGNQDWRDASFAGASAFAAERSGPMEFCAEATRRLQSVSEKLGRFLQEQIKRLESATRQCEEILTQRSSVQQQQQQLRREQAEWTEQQNQLQDEIRIEQDRLIQQWQNLEDEQRRLLSQDSSTGATAMPQQASVAPSNVQPMLAAPIPVTPDRSVFADATYHQPPPAVTMSRESALEQFQRLKREVRNHTQRVHQVPRQNGNH